MENLTFLEVYLVTVIACFALTVMITKLLNRGLKVFFDGLTDDKELSKFFTKMVSLILMLAGFSAALANSYVTGEAANWLTLSWDSVNQFQATLENLFVVLISFSVVFFILHLFNRRLSK